MLERGLARRIEGGDKFLVDLSGETLRQLKETGLDVEVDVLGHCTVQKAELYPSHRRRDREEMNGILSFLAFEP